MLMACRGLASQPGCRFERDVRRPTGTKDGKIRDAAGPQVAAVTVGYVAARAPLLEVGVPALRGDRYLLKKSFSCQSLEALENGHLCPRAGGLWILRLILDGFRRESVVVFRALFPGTGPGGRVHRDTAPRISCKCAHGWKDTRVSQQRSDHNHHNHNHNPLLLPPPPPHHHHLHTPPPPPGSDRLRVDFFFFAQLTVVHG